MRSGNSYSRKISSKEAEKGFIFILKNKLSFFPDDRSFELSDDNITRIVSVKSYPCTCRGPDLAHEHYYIPWDGLEPGNIIEIKRNEFNPDKYCMNFL